MFSLSILPFGDFEKEKCPSYHIPENVPQRDKNRHSHVSCLFFVRKSYRMRERVSVDSFCNAPFHILFRGKEQIQYSAVRTTRKFRQEKMSFVTGHCLCGQITVSVPKAVFEAPDKNCVCHCKNCRQSSGSLASMNLMVSESDTRITGRPKIYQDQNTDSGATIQRAFCDSCGSPIYGASPNVSGIKFIKLGLFDEIPKPSMELYCKTRPSWNKPIDGTKQFDAMPTK